MRILNSATSVLFRHSSRVPWCWASSKHYEIAFSQPKKYFQISSAKNKALSSNDLFKVSVQSEKKLKLRDGVPDEYELIYKAPMESSLRVWSYPTILSCFLAGPAYILYYRYYLGQVELETNTVVGALHFTNPYVEIWIFSAALATFACAAFAVMFKFPFRIYKLKDEQEYLALFLSVIPLNPHLRHFYFTSAAQTKFKNPFYFFMEGSHYTLDKKKALVMPIYFRTPADLCKMVGQK